MSMSHDNQSENSELMQSVPRKLLILDIDHNIVEIFLKEGEESELSKSVNLSSSIELDKPELMPNVHGYKGVLINRQSWLELFKEIIAVNKLYHDLAGNEKLNKPALPLIKVQFLTAASYTQKEFMELFKKAYHEINVRDIERYLIGDDEKYYHNKKSQEQYFPGSRASPSLLKAEFMEAKYRNNWAREGYKKADIVLVDDNLETCEFASRKGFTSIHHPTSPRRRAAGTLYSETKDTVFSRMREFVNSANEFCRIHQRNTDAKL